MLIKIESSSSEKSLLEKEKEKPEDGGEEKDRVVISCGKVGYFPSLN